MSEATIDRELPVGRLGYAWSKEDRVELAAKGTDPRVMLAAAAKVPAFNADVHPGTLFNPWDQLKQGSCQGHSLSTIFTICFYLLTGNVEYFSRAAAYYLSQRFDGISGDRGSTLNGGRKVATEHGLCLESDWPYPSRYDPTEPSGIEYPFKLVASKPTRDPELIFEALDLGLPVQDGIIWDSSVSRTRSTHYVGQGGGGHSTCLWTKSDDDYRRINSWDMWDGDGCNENTPESLAQQIKHRYSTHIIYMPEGMLYPDLDPVDTSNLVV